ncbi:MAG: TlyA family rRNA (cytidine-2'-O)-methyltransferase [Chloroflexi bacterium]|nr:TlyA family rRNA (cytidine-2'-O)-methyltransferase [Chloroflexota bacterium]
MAKKEKLKLNDLLLQKNIVKDLRQAEALILSGKVILNNRKISPTPGLLVDKNIDLKILDSPDFVSKGGYKLKFALEKFKIDVGNLTCLDIGSSTGGFTDCLIKNGAKKVYSVDVGRGQLHNNLKNDKRVISLEKTNAAFGINISESFEFLVADVSFTSLSTVLKKNLILLKKNAGLIVLLKPQFEANKNLVPKGGVVKDTSVYSSVIGRFIFWAINNKLRVLNISKYNYDKHNINTEFLIYLKKY